MTGFTGDEIEIESIYETFVGKPGRYNCGQFGATGILKEFNKKEGYMLIQPSIVANTEEEARIEEKSPTIISIEQGQPLVFRPLREGDIERILKENNQKINNKNSPQ